MALRNAVDYHEGSSFVRVCASCNNVLISLAAVHVPRIVVILVVLWLYFSVKKLQNHHEELGHECAPSAGRLF